MTYVLRCRRLGVHWRQIVADLDARTGGRVQVTERSLQLWTRDLRDPKPTPAPAPVEDPVDAEIRGVNEWLAEQRAMAAAR